MSYLSTILLFIMTLAFSGCQTTNYYDKRQTNPRYDASKLAEKWRQNTGVTYDNDSQYRYPTYGYTPPQQQNYIPYTPPSTAPTYPSYQRPTQPYPYQRYGRDADTGYRGSQYPTYDSGADGNYYYPLYFDQ